MPAYPNSNNSFLLDLLRLQQDGRDAISAPTNWTRSTPLLEVPTELDEVVAELAETCLIGDGNALGRWHFFIGSPGNGKSAAVGQLVRRLIHEHRCTVLSDDGTDIEALAADSVPYLLNVFEEDKKYPSVRIVQDASVVRHPYANDVDPARDLLATLSESWDRGISLVICTNRGVLEKAFRETYLDSALNQQPWHKAILRPLAETTDGRDLSISPIPVAGHHPVFSSIKPTAKFLDSRSLILGGNRIFDRLIQRAVEPSHWAECENCSARTLCPFKTNRDWLADAEGRNKIVQIFRRAEVLSTQVVVLREALAAISFLLAGCPRDYHSDHPCEWVRDQAAAGDIFGLAGRRIYMSLFSSGFPRGLESDESLRSSQLESLGTLIGTLQPSPYRRALQEVVDSPAPSTDVGITRLLGRNGIFSELDAIQGPLPSEFFDAWDGAYDRVMKNDSPLVSDIERQCAAAWYELETAAENMPSHLAPDAFWAIRRWSTQFTLHLGTLIEGTTVSANDLDEFAELLELLSKNPNDRTSNERRRQWDLEQMVEQLLNRNQQEDGRDIGVQLSENVSVLGSWLNNTMRPQVSASSASGSLTIAIEFGNAHDFTVLAAPMYLWLKQRATGKMDPKCLPSDLLSDAMDAKARAVAKSSYAFEPEGVSLDVVGDRDHEYYTLIRHRGEVYVDVHDRP